MRKSFECFVFQRKAVTLRADYYLRKIKNLVLSVSDKTESEF
jgi:hypothetical protein